MADKAAKKVATAAEATMATGIEQRLEMLVKVLDHCEMLVKIFNGFEIVD